MLVQFHPFDLRCVASPDQPLSRSPAASRGSDDRSADAVIIDT
jgi:hypothetical protein